MCDLFQLEMQETLAVPALWWQSAGNALATVEIGMSGPLRRGQRDVPGGPGDANRSTFTRRAFGTVGSLAEPNAARSPRGGRKPQVLDLLRREVIAAFCPSETRIAS